MIWYVLCIGDVYTGLKRRGTDGLFKGRNEGQQWEGARVRYKEIGFVDLLVADPCDALFRQPGCIMRSGSMLSD
jgi:hypothetical protein